jgi:hypothetical protein
MLRRKRSKRRMDQAQQPALQLTLTTSQRRRGWLRKTTTMRRAVVRMRRTRTAWKTAMTVASRRRRNEA